MNDDIIKRIIKAKLHILDSIADQLPDIAKARVNSLQHKLMTIISEAADEYVEKKKPDSESKQVKTVSVE